MLTIFQAMVDLFGYPGDSFEEWAAFLRDRGPKVLTAEEYETALNWITLWTYSLQSMLKRMNPQRKGEWTWTV